VEINKALAEPALRRSYADSAQEPVGGTAEAFSQLVAADLATFERLAKELNVKIE
jgi:tripartite-type tricarboxylate transporter receptor subunit TctC